MENEEKKWFVARKKPIVVAFREVSPEGETIDTREGMIKAYPEIDYIIRGVEDEEYPIKKEIFDKTYHIVDAEESGRFPIVITDEAVLELIRNAKALEWIANHQYSKYQGKMFNLWAILKELYNLDFEKHTYTLASEIATIYYVREKVTDFENKDSS